LKILQVVSYFPPAYAFGGPVKAAYQIARELVKRTHEVVVYTSDAKDLSSRLIVDPGEAADGIKVHYFRNLAFMPVRKFKLFITLQLVLHAKEEVKRFDVIHLHEYRTFQNIVIAHYARKHGVPYVLQARGSLPRIMAKQKLKWIYDVILGYRLLRNASKVIALTQMEVQQYEDMGVPEEKIVVIPNSIDLEEYRDLPPKRSFKKKFFIDDDEKIVLYLGRIHRIKGIDILVKAFAKVVEKSENVKLVVIGPDDGYLGELEALTKALKIEDHVLIIGPLYGKDKLEAYVDTTVFVVPSRYEIFGNVVLESYACSKPVVATRVGGLQEIVFDGKTGLLVEPGDVNELSSAIFTLLNDDETRISMGAQARRMIEGKFSVENTVDKLETTYSQILRR